MKIQKQKKGFSLVEVMASIAISAILFSMIYTGFYCHRSQIQSAGQIIACTKLLDQKLAQWSTQPHKEKIQSQGWLDQKEEISWKLEPLTTQESLQDLGIKRYRINVRKKGRLVFFTEILWEHDFIEVASK